MTTGNETDPRDDALAEAWRAQSQDLPPPALDATILAAAHRAVGSGPRAATKQALEATRPQRWWMPLAAAATIGVVAIGILQIAPQAPVDIVVGERAEVAGRVAPFVPAAPAKDAVQGSVVAPLQEAASAKNVEQAKAVAPTTAMPAPEPFPADKMSGKADTQSPTRQNERKDAGEAQRAPAPYNEAATRSEAKAPSARLAAPAPAPAPMAAPAPMVAQAPAPPAAPASTPSSPPSPAASPAPMVAPAPAPPVARAPAPSMLAPAPMKKESMAGAAGSLAAADSAGKPATAARERDTARDETSARNAPAAASSELARSTASIAELQTRARDPDAWIVRIRKLRADGRVAEAVAEVREFRRYVPDAETRLPSDLRQLVPIP